MVVTLGDQISDTTLLRVRSLAAELKLTKSPAIIDVVPAYTTVTVFYEIVPASGGHVPPFECIQQLVVECLKKSEHRWPELLRENLEQDRRPEIGAGMEIPVCYGGAFGPDLDELARFAGLTAEEVIALHSQPRYDVHAVGFTPGFPYLGGLSPKLHMPRRATPRVEVPAGSVGIGGAQTGIYPLRSPGGWQIIGRTPLNLFNVRVVPPARLQVGDRVRFKPISLEEFWAWQ